MLIYIFVLDSFNVYKIMCYKQQKFCILICFSFKLQPNILILELKCLYPCRQIKISVALLFTILLCTYYDSTFASCSNFPTVYIYICVYIILRAEKRIKTIFSQCLYLHVLKAKLGEVIEKNNSQQRLSIPRKS